MEKKRERKEKEELYNKKKRKDSIKFFFIRA